MEEYLKRLTIIDVKETLLVLHERGYDDLVSFEEDLEISDIFTLNLSLDTTEKLVESKRKAVITIPTVSIEDQEGTSGKGDEDNVDDEFFVTPLSTISSFLSDDDDDDENAEQIHHTKIDSKLSSHKSSIPSNSSSPIIITTSNVSPPSASSNSTASKSTDVLSPGGLFSHSGFQIAPHGIDYIPESISITLNERHGPCKVIPKRIRESIVLLEAIGKGGSSIVYRALYLPRLIILAVKIVRVDRSSAVQTVNELKTLFSFARHSLTDEIFDDNDFLHCSRVPNNTPEDEITPTTAADKGEPLRAIYATPVTSRMTVTSLFTQIVAAVPASLAYCSSIWQSMTAYLLCNTHVPSVANNLQFYPVNLYNIHDCPYILKFYDAYTEKSNNSVCIVLEYMNGGSVQTLIDKKVKVDENDIAIIAYSIAVALQTLHQKNIIHRDIKPGNILIDHDGYVKLSDFGIVKELSDLELAETFIGSLLFMSPERKSGEGYSYKSDIWSLGKTIASLSTLADTVIPFQKESAGGSPTVQYRSTSATCTKSHDLSDFINQCLQLDVDLRPDTTQLLHHPFITNAISRGVIDPNRQPKLQNIGHNNTTFTTLNTIVDKIFEWHILHLEPSQFTKNIQLVMEHSDEDKPGHVLHDQVSWLCYSYSTEEIQQFAKTLQIAPNLVQKAFQDKNDKLTFIVSAILPKLINSHYQYSTSAKSAATTSLIISDEDKYHLIQDSNFSNILRNATIAVLQGHSLEKVMSTLDQYFGKKKSPPRKRRRVSVNVA